MNKKKIAIFASGTGSNALQLIKHFKNHPNIQVALIVTNSTKAPVIKVAQENDVPFSVVNKSLLSNNSYMTSLLNLYDVDFIVLAGFLLLVPPFLVKIYNQKMINIHPALLPKYGGKGMHGLNVHQAVISAGDTETGITIHYVNEEYDKGEIILQAKCEVKEDDTAETLSAKIRALEFEYFPKAIEKII